MSKTEITTYCPDSKKAWRKWLMKNHETEQSVWLICYKISSGIPSISWSDAVDEALCFGWIDSVRRPIDNEKFMQFFSKRKPKGTWSKINKDKIEQLIAAGLMMPAGLDSIEKAKQNGSWTILDEVEALIIPKDLEKAFKNHPGSKDFYLSLSKSIKKQILHWLMTAKQTDTRQKRIAEIVESAAQNLKPERYR
ncbi:MAG: YdeI/OmpD-associated family protein [Bacteroidota bacterium]